LKIAVRELPQTENRARYVSFKKLFGYTFDQMVSRLKRKADVRQTPCAFCGVMRRKALNIAARDIKADKLATAHTLDDETQTILLNIFHGDVCG